jgi:5-methylcytosine-specific restriction endonuclease McrA|nr:HNH endonuclease signature motif containing protein [uncultured Acetatifactor sp.]
MPQKRNRPDHDGTHRLAFERNKKRILASQDCCGICGKPVDKNLKYPAPLSPCIDHIIPIDRGGHPSDMANLQLAHWICNRQKSNKLTGTKKKEQDEVSTNRMLPQSMDWRQFREKSEEK